MIPQVQIAWTAIKTACSFWRELLIVALLAVAGFLSYQLQGVRGDFELYKSQKALGEAENRAGKAETALDLFDAAAKRINTAAAGLRANAKATNAEMDEILEKLKNERAPLPADCRPDDVRMRALEDAIKRANEQLAAPR